MKFCEIQHFYRASADPSARMEFVSLLIDVEEASWESVEAFAVEVLLKESNPIVRHEAAFVLGELRERGRIADDIGAAALRHAAEFDQSVVVRHEAAEAIYCFQGDMIDETLRRLLNDTNEDVRLTASMSLSWRERWKRHADTIELLRS